MKHKSYYREAEEYFSEALTITKKNQINDLEKDVIRKLIDIGREYYRQGNFENAKELFKCTNNNSAKPEFPLVTSGKKIRRGPG